MQFSKSFIALIIFTKLVIFIFLALQFQDNKSDRVSGSIFVKQGETLTYFQPIEHILKGEGYSLTAYDSISDAFTLQPSARRMPGILPIMLPLRTIINQSLAQSCFIIFQFILSILSVFALGQIIYSFTSSNIIAHVSTLLYALSSFVGIYDHIGLTESLSVSSSIFSIYYYLKATNERKHSHLLTAGLFLAWSIFLRPATVLFAPLFAVDLFLNTRKHSSISNIFKYQILVFAPLVIALTFWTARNFMTFQKLIVFEDSVFDSMPHIYTPAEKALRPLLNHWGGQRKKFYPNTMGAYFYGQTDDQSIFPKAIFENSFNLDSLLVLRSLFIEAHRNPHSYAEEVFIEKSESLRNTFKANHPIKYFIEAPIKSLLRFYFIKTENQLPFPALSEMSLIQKAIKVANILLYDFIAVVALFGVIIAIINKNNFRFVLLFPFLYCFVLGCVLYNTEIRYLASAFPFMILSASICLTYLKKKIPFADKLN